MRMFEVEVGIRKGLGPESSVKTISVGLDDLDPGLSEEEIVLMAVRDAEEQLRRSDDYALYGKTWWIREVYNA